MKLKSGLIVTLFLAVLMLSPAVLYAKDSSPQVSVKYSDAEIELILAQHIEKMTKWSWSKKTLKSGNEFIMFSFNLGKDFPFKIVLDAITISKDRKTNKPKAKIIKFFAYTPGPKMKVKDKAAALAAINQWNGKSYFPRTVKVDRDNEIVCDFFILLDESAPVQAGQAYKMMERTLYTWVKFAAFLQSKGAIN